MPNFTQTQLDKLRAAYASGALTVESNGERITYQNSDAMLQAIRVMEADLAGGSAQPMISFAAFSRD